MLTTTIYTLSLTTLFRSYGRYTPSALAPILNYVNTTLRAWMMRKFKRYAGCKAKAGHVDRKSTRLNSSHPSISYAVFCLKKKMRDTGGGDRLQISEGDYM